MVAFNKFFSSVFLAVLCATYGNAAPSLAGFKHSTHRVRSLDNGLKVELFHPSSSYQTFGQGLGLLSSLVGLDSADQTVSFVSSQLQMDSKNIAFKSGYTSNDGVTFGYAKQSHNGISFINAVANVAFKDNKVVAFGSSFVPINKIADSNPTVDVNTVIPKVEEVLQGKKNEIELSLEYLVQEDGSVALVHVFQVQDEMNSWYEAYADAHTGELVSVTDFVAKASAQNLPSPNHHEQYRALPAWKQDIREGLQYLLNPEDEEVSPKGWLSGNRTEGNNVVSFKGNQDATSVANRRQLGLVFDYTYDPAKAPTEGDNLDAARVNAFYIANTYHDVLYRYGFTEEAFNYQTDSFGKGKGGDPVLLSVQDASGTNDAKFFHTPDGQPGRCLMFIFTATRPARDGVMQNDILIHELTHGLTNRMTGGGTARCLQTLEARGLGEGWSDAVADWFAQSDNVSIVDFTTGNWVLNNAGGVRSKPYSTSTAVNDKKYSTIAGLNEEHYIGEVWANMLHNVLAELVLARGVSKNALTDASGTTGNVVFLNLLVKGLALQPCNPTLPAARDAIIQADQNLYAGGNKCLLWKTFASRGLGVGAKDYRDSSDVPKECQDDVV
ncbi:hypothetical protein AAF712_010517 [Marasmius tenuissimus]|uniref:Extracellular metalloproteinase n=1 Tax=Marasmius tenuissimus TaxID=585030 RepID=A0ABR2ZPB8_9AGAR